MSRAKLPVQIKSGQWYAFAHGPPLLEECCDCGLVHMATLRPELKSDGTMKFWVKWDRDDKETRKARRRPQAYVRRKP